MSKLSRNLRELVEWLILGMFLGCIPHMHAKQTNPTEQEFKNSTPSFGVRLLKKADKVDWSPKAQAEADKVYDSTLAVIQREKIGRELKPTFTLILGGEKDEITATVPQEPLLPLVVEIRLKKWDPYKFAQGVIKAYCFELIDRQEVLRLAARASAWANASVDVGDLKQ
jgi:hypothetical protein